MSRHFAVRPLPPRVPVTSPASYVVDCGALLTRQLAELAALIVRLRDGSSDEERARLFSELSNRAVLHVLSRERVLLPAWRRIHQKDLPPDAMAVHLRFKQALAELLVRRPWMEGHAEALGAFAEQVEQQRLVDHGHLVPVLRHAMDVQQRRDICNEVELLFEAANPPSSSSTDGASPYDLLQEAELVLGALAALWSGNRMAAA